MDGATADLELPGIGAALATSLLSLGLVCLLAWLLLRWLSRRKIGVVRRGPIEILARCPLESRRALYLVKAAGRTFLVGAGEGPVSMLAELDDEAMPSVNGRAERSGTGEASVDTSKPASRGHVKTGQAGEVAGTGFCSSTA